MKRFLLGLVAVLALSASSSAAAFEFLQPNAAGNARLEAGQNVDDTVLVAGQNVDIRAQISKDLFAAAGILTVDSPVGGNVVGGAQTVTINNSVVGDIMVAGGTVTVSDQASIEGDVLVFAGTVEIAGSVKGDVTAYAGVVSIDGTVTGNVTTQADQVLIGEQGQIGGTLSGTVAKPLDETAASKVAGGVDVSLDSTGNQQADVLRLFAGSGTVSVMGMLYSLLTAIVTGLLLIFLFPKLVEQVRKAAYTNPGQNGLIGLATMLVAPALFLVTMVLFVTIPIGFLELLVVGLFVLLGGIVGNIWVGDLISKAAWSPLAALAAGAVILGVLSFIPVLGVLLSLAAWLVGVGTVAHTTWMMLRKAEK